MKINELTKNSPKKANQEPTRTAQFLNSFEAANREYNKRIKLTIK